MWFLPSRGRAKLCQECLDACADMKMTLPGIVYVDTRISDYPDLKLPSNWIKVLGDKDLARAKQEFYEQHPDVPFYGLLCDDLVPQTPYFDKEYENAVEDWYMVDCNDVGYVTREMHLSSGLPIPMSGAYAWGAKLVHTVGWWSLPGVQQFGNDVAWTYMLHRLKGLGLNLRVYLSDVIIEHKNWRTEKRLKDETDNWFRDGANYRDPDLLVLERTKNNGTLNRLVDKIYKTHNAASINTN